MPTIKKQTHDSDIKKQASGNEVFIIAECESIVCTVRQKAIFTKIDASDYTDALLKFKELRHINRLPSHTMIFPESVVNYYPKGV